MPTTTAPLARFAFSAQAEPFRLRAGAPHVHGYAWRHPDPAAALVLVHGLQSHAQWFAEAADGLLARGRSVFALDRRGSGSSPGPRGDVRGYGDWLDEVADVVALARREHPGVPVHLVGHCFGANVALACVLERRPPVASLALLTPGLRIKPRYGVGDSLRILAAARLAPATRFPVPQDDALFTRDPAVLAWIRADRRGARTVTARCLLEAEQMGRRARAGLLGLDLPLLVVEAARDRLSDTAANRALIHRAWRRDWRIASFDGEHHLLAEPCRDAVLDELARWSA
jgi:acylglycerol lipase